MSTATHHTIEIPEKDITLYLPKELKHCNSSEFSDVALLLYNWQSGSITYQEFRVQAIYRLLNLKSGKRHINDIEVQNAFSNIERLSLLMDGFFNDVDGDKRIKLDLVENPVPTVHPLTGKVKGPKARLTDTTFGQYEDASNAYAMYYRNQNDKYLWQLFAIYYQNPKTYKKENIEKRIKHFKDKIDFANVFGFFLFFESFQNYITSSKVLWEGKVIDLSILYATDKDAPKSELPGLGTKSLTFHIAKLGIMGNIDQARSQNLWEVLLLLYDIRKTELDEKAEAKRNKQNS